MPDGKPKRRTTPASKPEPQPGPHHIADEPVEDADAIGATVQRPVTESGLPVEEQIRKEWDPKDGGLPIPLRPAVERAK
jgi:hypothetical protein